MKYEILGADDLKNLEKVVADAIADGWEPLGGVGVSSHHETWENSRKGYTDGQTVYTYVQAMILKVPKGEGLTICDMHDDESY